MPGRQEAPELEPYVHVVGMGQLIPSLANLNTYYPPSAIYRHYMAVITSASGFVDGLYICKKLASDIYEWVPINADLVDFAVFNWLMFNGAINGTLNGGCISTSRLLKVSANPGVQFKVDLNKLSTNTDLLIQLICAHSTVGQTLDLDLEPLNIGITENFNTKAVGVSINATPTTPAVAYDWFAANFTIPIATLSAGGSFEGRIVRDNTGADTGDLDIWGIRAFQFG